MEICLDDLGRNKQFALVEAADIVGRPLYDLMPPHVGKIVSAGVAAALSTGTMQTLHYEVAVEGRTRHRDARILPQSVDVALIVIRDVTDSQEIEAELRHSEARLREAQRMRASAPGSTTA